MAETETGSLKWPPGTGQKPFSQLLRRASVTLAGCPMEIAFTAKAHFTCYDLLGLFTGRGYHRSRHQRAS